jgi:hypothetical protein
MAPFLVSLCVFAVLVPAFAGFGRPRTYAWIGFLSLIAGGVLLVLTPTPDGFDPNGRSTRWLLSTLVGQDVSAALFATGAAALLGAYVVGPKSPATRAHPRLK